MLTTIEFGMTSRVASSILLAVMLNITALGGGLYAIQAHPRTTGSAGVVNAGDMGAMAGMDMGQSGSHESDAPNDEGCTLPWAPGCAFQALCVPVAMTVHPLLIAAVPHRHTPPVIAVDLAPASADRSPDHPPPRV